MYIQVLWTELSVTFQNFLTYKLELRVPLSITIYPHTQINQTVYINYICVLQSKTRVLMNSCMQFYNSKYTKIQHLIKHTVYENLSRCCHLLLYKKKRLIFLSREITEKFTHCRSLIQKHPSILSIPCHSENNNTNNKQRKKEK